MSALVECGGFEGERVMFYVVDNYKCGRCEAEHCVVFFAPLWVASKCRACRDARVTPGNDCSDALIELAKKVVEHTVDFWDSKSPLRMCSRCRKTKDAVQFIGDCCAQCWIAERERERKKQQ